MGALPKRGEGDEKKRNEQDFPQGYRSSRICRPLPYCSPIESPSQMVKQSVVGYCSMDCQATQPDLKTRGMQQHIPQTISINSNVERVSKINELLPWSVSLPNQAPYASYYSCG
jgi:hypothetical protein